MRARLAFFTLFSSGLIAGHTVAAMSPDFTPGAAAAPCERECVVQIAAPGPGTSLERAQAAFAARAAALGLTVAATLGGRAQPAEMAGRPARAGSPRTTPFGLDPARVVLLRARDAASLREACARLRDDAGVEWLEPNLSRSPCDFPADGSMPDDPLLRDTRQWGLWNAGAAGVYRGLAGADVAAREAWALTCGSGDVILAIGDTGVDPGHPDLQCLLPGGAWRMTRGRNVSTGPASAWADSNGHGTAVAGVMAAFTHDGAHFDSLGVAGVCGGDGHGNPGCRLIPIKISPGGFGFSSSFEIASAIVYATNCGARAMNLSFAGGGDSRVERLALYYAITRGCVVVAASGNHGFAPPTAVMYPAAYAAEGLCVAVGASDARDRRATFSSYGVGLDLVAPGLDVWTTAPTYPNAFGARYPGYLAGSGTSFAAPFVTGTIGLMAARRPDLTDTDFQQLLRATARDVGAAGWDLETAWGRLDAAEAVRAASPEAALWHDERPAQVRATGRMGALNVAPDSFGTFDRSAQWRFRQAELCEATVTFTLPDSFADSARVWPRVGGTMALRGDFQLLRYSPWAEVAAREGRRVTLRGYLYRVPMAASEAAGARSAFGVAVRRESARSGHGIALAHRRSAVAIGLESEPDSADFWLPLPPDQARIGFTVFGAADRTPRLAAEGGDAGRRPLRVWPNPSRGLTRIAGPPGERIVVLDLAGRVVREAALDASRGEFVWDGRDRAAGRVRPGLYFVRAASGVARAQRIVRIE